MLPSVNVHPIPCSDASWKDDKSFTDQWAAASGTADSLHRKLNETPAINADVKKALEDALKVYDDMYKALTASDKGDPLLAHVLP